MTLFNENWAIFNHYTFFQNKNKMHATILEELHENSRSYFDTK